MTMSVTPIVDHAQDIILKLVSRYELFCLFIYTSLLSAPLFMREISFLFLNSAFLLVLCITFFKFKDLHSAVALWGLMMSRYLIVLFVYMWGREWGTAVCPRMYTCVLAFGWLVVIWKINILEFTLWCSCVSFLSWKQFAIMKGICDVICIHG